MNFFQQIAALQVAGDWKITIAMDKQGGFIVSVLFFNEQAGDGASKKVPPMLLKGSPQEIDEGFFAAIEQPVKETAQLFTNMEQYLKEREQARLASQMEKDKEGKDKKDKDERKKKYDALIKKVDELEEARKYQEAIATLPKADNFPEQAEDIAKRLEHLRQKNGQLSLL
jgi:PRTRC genetic system protein E